jgi:hypothetical protein
VATTAVDVRHRPQERKDLWWLEPTVIVVVLGLFVLYSIYAGLVGANYYKDPYLSPLYSPCISANCVHPSLPIVGTYWNLSPAILIVAFPLAFRVTCYYYRRSYYRAFFWSPPACAVPDARKTYSGETRFPFIFQNLHRYFFWIATAFNVILSIDAVIAFRDHHTGAWGHMGLGALVLVVNAVLLWLYSLSCHACRHAVGGRLRNFSRHPARYWAWTQVSKLNARHMQYAWISLFWVLFADLYIRLVASGVISDPRFF